MRFSRALLLCLSHGAAFVALGCAPAPPYDPEVFSARTQAYRDLIADDEINGIPLFASPALTELDPLPVQDLPQAIAALRDPDPFASDVRLGALLALASQELPPAVDPLPFLTRALQDPEPGMRLIALRGLRRCDPLPLSVADELKPLLAEEDYELRNEASVLLLAYGPELLPRLSVWADNSSDEVRRSLPLFVGQIRTVEASRLLARMMKDPDPTVRGTAISALYDRGTANVAIYPELIEALRDSDISLARGAIAAIANSGPALKVLLPELKTFFLDSNFEPGYELGSTFKVLGPAAEPILFEALKHPDPTIRRRACDTIISFQLGSPRVSVELLRVATSDRDVDVRLRAWDTLCETDSDYQKEDTPLVPPGFDEYAATRTEPTPDSTYDLFVTGFSADRGPPVRMYPSPRDTP